MTVKLQRFDFGTLRDFRRPIAINAAALKEEVKEAPPPPPPPTYNEQDIETARLAAKKLGYAEGFEAGMQQATTETAARERDTQQSLENINGQLTELMATYGTLVTQQSAELSELVIMIARKVADVALDAKGVDTIAATVNRCLPIIFAKPSVSIDLHPEMLNIASPVLQNKLAEQGFSGEVKFRANDTLSRHDVKIDWGNGQAGRSTESLWLEIEALLQQVSLAPQLPERPVITPSNPTEETV